MDGSIEASKSGLVRALAVLDHVKSKAPETLGVTQIARELDLPKAVAYRILKDFAIAGYLTFDAESKLYGLGPKAFALGLTALRSLDIPTVARPHMEELVRLTSETATLSIRQGWSRVYLDQVEAPREIRMSVALGSRHSLHAGSSSKAILAAMSDSEISAFFEMAGSLALTESGVELGELRADIAVIRSRGYAVSLGERQAGAGSVAAPLYTVSGTVWGSISLCGPRNRFHADACAENGQLVAAAAREISGGLTPFSSVPLGVRQ